MISARYEVREDSGSWIVWDAYLCRAVETDWSHDGQHLDENDATALAESMSERSGTA